VTPLPGIDPALATPASVARGPVALRRTGMPFTIIEGTFHVVGKSPDGDSVGFRANDSANWQKLTGPTVKRNSQGVAQLRFEAIDALETHFTPTGQHHEYHQPKVLAEAAQTSMLDAIGITNLVWDAGHRTVRSATNDGAPGYILARSVEKNHRPVSFVYAGSPPQADGTSIRLDVPLLQQSVNFRLATDGLVYPTYYQGLFHDLRDAITATVADARTAKRGIWEMDATNSGVLGDLDTLQDVTPILPKLFRRLMEYMDGVSGHLEDFKDFLAAKSDGLTVISTGQFTHLDTFVQVDTAANTVLLTEQPENLRFDE
jgi:hypothetical protein